MSAGNRIPHSSTTMNLILAAICVAALFAIGCGGSNSSLNNSPNVPPPPTASKAVAAQVRLGDGPADRVISFEVTVGPITMTPVSGPAVTALSGKRRLEVTHLSATNEPLALLNLPQGTYSSASMTVSNPEVTFVNNAGALVELKPAFNKAIGITFSPAVTVGATSTVISIDLNVAKSLTFDALGNATGVNLSTSSFTFSSSAVAAEDHQRADDGELEDTTGKVTSVSGSSFTMKVGWNGASLSFSTDAATEFNDGASLGTMLNNIVKVEGVTKADGTLYAKEVEGIENANGAELEGLLTQVSGNPASQLSFSVDDGVGNGMDDNMLGTNIKVDVDNSTNYKVSKGNVDTSGIGGLPSSPNFPFDGSTIHAGQRVEVESLSAISITTNIADKVKLQQQALTGTVSGLAGSTAAGPTTFTLTLPSDSAFAMLSGKTGINVYWQGGTDLHNLSGVNNGDIVRVRGLVFFTGTAFNMIARRIDR